MIWLCGRRWWNLFMLTKVKSPSFTLYLPSVNLLQLEHLIWNGVCSIEVKRLPIWIGGSPGAGSGAWPSTTFTIGILENGLLSQYCRSCTWWQQWWHWYEAVNCVSTGLGPLDWRGRWSRMRSDNVWMASFWPILCPGLTEFHTSTNGITLNALFDGKAFKISKRHRETTSFWTVWWSKHILRLIRWKQRMRDRWQHVLFMLRRPFDWRWRGEKCWPALIGVWEGGRRCEGVMVWRIAK